MSGDVIYARWLGVCVHRDMTTGTRIEMSRVWKLGGAGADNWYVRVLTLQGRYLGKGLTNVQINFAVLGEYPSYWYYADAYIMWESEKKYPNYY